MLAFKNHRKNYSFFYIAILTMGFLLSIKTKAQPPVSDSYLIKVAYLYKFIENTNWAGEDTLKSFKITVFTSNENYINNFKLLQNVNVKGKPIVVNFVQKINTIPSSHCIFIGEDALIWVEKLNRKFKNQRNTLIVTSNYWDQDQIMVNLLDQDQRVRFEINRTNLDHQNLRLNTTLMVLGGSKFDWVDLYKDKNDTLGKEKQKVRIQQELLAKSQEDKILLQQLTESNKRELESQKMILDKQQEQLNQQTFSITEKESLLTNLRKEIVMAYTKFNDQQKFKEIQDLELEMQNEKIANGIEVMKAQSASILLQKRQLQSQSKILNQQKLQIDIQQNILYIVVIGLIMLAVGTYFIFKYYRLQMVYNKELARKNKEILDQKEEIVRINEDLEEKVEHRTSLILTQNQKLIDYAFFNAHKVRGPLARILGLVSISKISRMDDIEPQKLFELIDESAKELDNVIKEISNILDLVDHEKVKNPEQKVEEFFENTPTKQQA